MTIMINSRAAVCATLVASAAAPLLAAAALSAAAPGTPPAEAMRPAALTGAPIVEAVKTGDRETAIALLREGADPNRAAPDGATALHWAAYRDDADTVDRLLGAGADPRAKNRYGVTPLALAAAGGYGAVVERLLDAGADPDAAAPDGTSALVMAAANAHWSLGALLLDAGADPNAAGQGWPALHQVVRTRNLNIGFFPHPEPTGAMSSLEFAAKLIAHGADVNARITRPIVDGFRGFWTQTGATPILAAAKGADAAMMRLLAEHGADASLTNDRGTTPLMAAAGVEMFNPDEDSGTNAEALEALETAIALGGDVNAVNRDGDTALHGAAWRGANAIILRLVEEGAALHVENRRGFTPLRIANGEEEGRVANINVRPWTVALLQKLLKERGLPWELRRGQERYAFENNPIDTRSREEILREHLERLGVSAAGAVRGGGGGGQPATSAGAAAGDDQWPMFRGPNAGAVADDPALPDAWSATENVVWKTAIPGLGWSSPVVWDDHVFLTSAVAAGPEETPVPGLYDEHDHIAANTVHRWMVYDVDAATGAIRWERELHRELPRLRRHVKNSYASETPVTDGERLYVYFGSIGLVAALDFEGAVVWQRRIGAFNTLIELGTAASPALHGDRLYVVNDNTTASFMVALDKRTGAEVWRVERDERGHNWSTPAVWENRVRTEIVTVGSDGVRSYGLDGALLWELKGMSNLTTPSPFVAGGLVYVSSGYPGGALRPVYAIHPGAEGDISLWADEASRWSTRFPGDRTSSEYVAWAYPLLGTYNTSALVYRGLYYTLLDRGLLLAHDARTGAEAYGRQRIRVGSGFTASPWGYNGKVFLLSEAGDTYVVRAGPEFEILGTNPLDEMTLATPAVVRGSLFIRTQSALYRIAKLDAP